MIILRATNQEGVTKDLDIIQDTDLLLDISAIESGEIGDVFGVSSQEFSLPGTDINQEFFGFLDNLGATPAVALTQAVDCQVLFNGQEIFTGRLYVSDVITDQQGDTIYNVVVVNETVDFKYQIQDLYLQDLDWSQYDHNLTYSNVISSWSGSLFNGDVAYPLIDYGYDEEIVSGNSNTQIVGGAGNRNFDNDNSPLSVAYLKPTIRLKSVIDAIFDRVNYTYSSSFFESSDFQNIFVASTQDDKLGSGFISPVSESFQVYNNNIQNISSNTDTTVIFQLENFDNGNNFSSNTYTADKKGTHKFFGRVKYAIGGLTDNNRDDLELYVAVNGSRVKGAGAKRNIKGTTGGTLFVGPVGIDLAIGDTVTLKVRRTYSPFGSRALTLLTSSTPTATKFEGSGPGTLAGGPVEVGKIFENEASVREFLYGVIQKFNLVVEPIVGERNKLRIEPFNTWVDQGQVVDWTDKVDRSVKFSIKHPLQTQPKKLIFKDEPDEDLYNTEYTTRTDKQYGDYIYQSESDLAEGEREIGSFFAATPMGTVKNAPDMIIPVLAQRKDGDVLTPYKYKPRLFYNLGIQPAGGTLRGYENSTQTNDLGNYFLQDESLTARKEGNYLLFHHLNSLDDNISSRKDLHFGNLNHVSFFPDNRVTQVKNSAYFDYWSFYVNELYDIDARLLTCNVLIDPTEIPTIRLNDKIFIDGHYYRINKINGANLLEEDSIEVELLKTLPRKLYFPRRRIVWFKGDADYSQGYKDVVLDFGDIVAGGTTKYRDYETGEVVTGSQDLGRVAPRDGVTVYGDTVVWDTLKPLQASFTAQSVLGNSSLDLSVDKARVLGDNNYVSSDVSKLTISGDDNTLDGLSERVTVSGRFNTLEVDTLDIDVQGYNNTIGSGSNDIGVYNGYSNLIRSSSVSSQLGGVSTDIIDSTQVITIGGLNNIVTGSTATIVIGGNGETYTGFNQHNIFGSTGIFPDDNFIGSDYRVGSNIMWDTYLEGAVYTNRHDYEIVAYSGSVDTAYSGNGLFKYVYNISFDSLVSGSGMSFIELPTIQSQDQLGRTILFLAGNGVSSTNRVRIKSFGDTDPVAGGTYYDLKAPDEFVELRATQKYDPIFGGYDYVWAIQGQSDSANIGAEGTHASYAHTGSQTIADTTQAYPVELNYTYTEQGISLSGSSAVVFDHAGTYQLTYVVQVANYANSVQDAFFWVKYNGVDFPNSNTICSLQPRKSVGVPSTQLATVSLVGEAQNDGDYIEIYWGADSTDIQLFSEGVGASPTRPATPSVIANIIHVG